MLIQDISLIHSQLPLKKPFTTALRSVITIDEIIIILHTQEYKGYGSAPATLAVTGDTLEKIEDDLRGKVIPLFTHYNLNDYRSCFEALHKLDICKSAQTAMDIALHDLFAKQARLPLYEYLGGRPRMLQTLYTISINAPQAMLEQAQQVYNEGFTKLKVKLDSNIASNIQRVHILHENLPQAELFLDINQAFSLEQSITFIEAIKSIPIQLLEQPVKANDFEAMKKLTDLKKIPILADETIFSYDDALKAIEIKACDYINIKLMKCGGIYEAKKILDLCQKKGIKCMMGCMLESGISVTAALHLAYAYECVIFADLDGPTLAERTLIHGGITYDKMSISLNKEIGVGISLQS